MLVEVSNGEIADKLSIIQIKLKYISDEAKLTNLRTEEQVLIEAMQHILPLEHALYQDLVRVNEALWHIEDACRAHEKAQDFGEKFIEIARSVYITNDERAKIKKDINLLTGSKLVEEKSYQ
jgi:Family of unknown function (DUF6165)